LKIQYSTRRRHQQHNHHITASETKLDGYLSKAIPHLRIAVQCAVVTTLSYLNIVISCAPETHKHAESLLHERISSQNATSTLSFGAYCFLTTLIRAAVGVLIHECIGDVSCSWRLTIISDGSHYRARKLN